MKILYDCYIINQKNIPTIMTQTIILKKKGWSFSVVENHELKTNSIPPIKITRLGLFKFRLEVKSDNYRKFEINKEKPQ